MQELERAAILTELIDQLGKHGSWCGETHIQKSGYMLQALLKVPLGMDFILYKYGPFSFDLRNELYGMLANGLVQLETREPYGPVFTVTEMGRRIRSAFPKSLADARGKIELVTTFVGEKRVNELEQEATALYVTMEVTGADLEERARQLSCVKPHISLESARDSIRRIDKFIAGIPQ
jgi:uncharacterized protein YwgA